MTDRFSARWVLLLAGTAGALFVTGSSVLAQQSPASPPPAAAPAAPAAQAPQTFPPGHPLYGRPNNEAASKLAPIPAPPIPTPADKLPYAKLKLPPGFKIELYASGMANPRSMREGANGTIFVGSRFSGNVYAVVDKGGKREVKILAKGLHRPNGIAFHNGSLYVAELNKVWRYDNIEKNLDNPGKPTLIYDKLPSDEPHGWKFIGIGPDNKLYIPVGAPCNICMPPEQTHAQMRRINLDGSGEEVVARGIRNTVGFDWHPVTKELWFTDNGRDWMMEDGPQEELNRVTKIGQHYGFPYCHAGTLNDPEHGWGRSCDEFVKPSALLGPHAAALGMRFYTGNMFPAKYKNVMFVSRRGSWNRTKKFGGDIVAVHLNKDGSVKQIEPFLTGFIENNNYLGRNSDLVFLKDGSMLINDDHNGAIYRITYTGGRQAKR